MTTSTGRGKKAACGLRAAPKAWDEARDATFIHAIPELGEDHKFGNLTLIPLNITARLCALFRCQIQPWRGGSGDARRRPPSSTLQGDSLACIQQLLDPGYFVNDQPTRQLALRWYVRDHPGASDAA